MASLALLAGCQNATTGSSRTGHASAPVERVAVVPFLTEKGRDAYRDFLGWSNDRAFALAADGSWGWASSRLRASETKEGAINRAFWNCQSNTNAECHIYAINQSVVLPKGLRESLTAVPVASLPFQLEKPPGWHRDYIVEDKVRIGPGSYSFVSSVGEGAKGNSQGIHARLLVRLEGQPITQWLTTYRERLMRRSAGGGDFIILKEDTWPVELPGGTMAEAHLFESGAKGDRHEFGFLTFEKAGVQHLISIRSAKANIQVRATLEQVIVPALQAVSN